MLNPEVENIFCIDENWFQLNEQNSFLYGYVKRLVLKYVGGDFSASIEWKINKSLWKYKSIPKVELIMTILSLELPQNRETYCILIYLKFKNWKLKNKTH